MSAEQRYREAFERLRANKPIRVPAGTPVSQNHVAQEAGVDASAFKRSRFKTLIDEIQEYVRSPKAAAPPSARQEGIAKRRRNRTLEEQLEAATQQRDKLASQLVDADAHILELRERVTELERTSKKS